MPNYVDNELWIYGEKKDLDIFKEKAKGKNGWLDIERLVPLPEKLLENEELADRQYDENIWDEIKDFENAKRMLEKMKIFKFIGIRTAWKSSHWGPEVPEFDHLEFEESEESIYNRFISVWTPPKFAFIKIGKLFPELNFELRYFESGMQFNGILIIEDGEVRENDLANYYGHRGG